MTREFVIAITFLGSVISAQGQFDFRKKPSLFSSSDCLSGDCEFGNGTANNAEGDLYYGEWRDGKPHGLGTVYFSLTNSDYQPGTFFTGRFAYGLIDGIGTFDFPGERRMTVRFQKSQDFAVFEKKGALRPRRRKHIMDDVAQWEGWKIRKETFFTQGSPDRLMVGMHQDYEGQKCWNTTASIGPVEVFFNIDTGCSDVALTKSTIDHLINKGVAIKQTGYGLYNTACGSEYFAQYIIPSLTIGGINFKNLKASETKSSDNLLGMNVLGAFGTLELNIEQQTLVLE